MRDAQVKVLSEYIDHHVEEEETEMFPKVREAKKLNLKAMGQELTDRKGTMLQALTNTNSNIDLAELATFIQDGTKH